MDDRRFISLVRTLTSIPTRRHVLFGLAALGLASGGSGSGTGLFEDAVAKKKKNKSKNKKGNGKKKRTPPVPPTSPPPPPSTCTPACDGKPCGVDDGCGAICGCAAGSVCHDGVCRACTVTCDGNGQTCANTLKAALAAGGTIYACPGRYVGNFEITAANVELVGAGSGANAAGSTILDANDSGRVLLVKQGATATLRSLRITGGNLTNDSDAGAGILNQGRLTVTGCSIFKNTAKNGGGIAQFSTAELAINGCAVTENTTAGYGGGIYGNAGPVTIAGSTFSGNKGLYGGALTGLGSAMTIRGCTITANRANLGAGLFNRVSATFDSGTRVSANIASEGGGGIYQDFDSTAALNGARIISNVPDNCLTWDGSVLCGNG